MREEVNSDISKEPWVLRWVKGLGIGIGETVRRNQNISNYNTYLDTPDVLGPISPNDLPVILRMSLCYANGDIFEHSREEFEVGQLNRIYFGNARKTAASEPSSK